VRILVLGGTVFLGRHVVEAAVAAGHDVALFNRGRHNAELSLISRSSAAIAKATSMRSRDEPSTL
jgi:nucleoside-diphosphate-sugar epimerase